MDGYCSANGALTTGTSAGILANMTPNGIFRLKKDDYIVIHIVRKPEISRSNKRILGISVLA
jgi:hypothetical protein